MSETQSTFISFSLLDRMPISQAIDFALKPDPDTQQEIAQNLQSSKFYLNHQKQLFKQVYLLQINYKCQQWILLKTDSQCQMLIKTVIQQLQIQQNNNKIVKKLQDLFQNIIHFTKKDQQAKSRDFIHQLNIIGSRINILHNQVFNKFIQFQNAHQRYVYRRFTMVKKNGGRYKEGCCKVGAFFSQWKKRQISVQYNGITYKNEHGQMKQYLPFSHSFQYFFGISQTTLPLGIILVSNHRRLVLQASNPQDYIMFLYLLKKKTFQSPYLNLNRFNSFAPIRQSNDSEFYIDGKDYFQALAKSLQNAKKSIYMTGWMISPEFLLQRNQQNISLFDICQQKSKQGVTINIFVYHQSSFLTNDSAYVKEKFQSLGPKVKVLRHPTGKLPILWSHHSKMVIIDKQQAFFGGLDLCYGRYDTNTHELFPQNKEKMYPGIQYNNCRLKDFENVRQFTIDHIDKRIPRLPWHDICQSVKGTIVSDFVHHFVQIWNFASYENQQVLNNDLLNSPTQHEIKTIKNLLSTKQSEQGFDENRLSAQKNSIIMALTNTFQQVKLKGHEGLTNLKSKFYPQKKKKLQELYRKRKNKNSQITFQDYVAEIEKQIQSKKIIQYPIYQQNQQQEQQNQRQIHLKIYSPLKNRKQSQQSKQNQISLAKPKSIKKTFSSSSPTKPKPNAQRTSLLIPDKQNQNLSSTNDQNYMKFLKNINIKNQEINVQVDKDIDSDEQAPGKMWQNKPFSFSNQAKGTQQCQLLRSASNWSIGCAKQNKQFSIQIAYLQLISQAQHYIYIQNQFFISHSCQTSQVKNLICQALYQKIKSRIVLKKPFKVLITLPLLPAFAGNIQQQDCTFLRMIMNWQNKTLKSLIQKIEKLGVNVTDYVKILGLRTHGLNALNQPKTEIVYVHSKMMIVDDRMAIVGSANINDRSLLGDRDSEIAVVTFGQDLIQANINDNQVIVSQKIQKFRKKLWKEHFQLDQKMLDDPVSSSLWSKISFLTQSNTKIYRKIFGCYPDNEMKTLSDLKQIKQKSRVQSYLQQIGNINGNAVQYPLNFLIHQPIINRVISKEYFIPTECLT